MKQYLKYVLYGLAFLSLSVSCAKGGTEIPSTNIPVNSARALYEGIAIDAEGNEYEKYQVILTLGESLGYEMKTAGAIIVLELNTEHGTGGGRIPCELAYQPIKEGKPLTYTFTEGSGNSPALGNGSFLGIKDSEFDPVEFTPIKNGLIFIENETGEYSFEGIIDTGEQAFTFNFAGVMPFSEKN